MSGLPSNRRMQRSGKTSGARCLPHHIVRVAFWQCVKVAAPRRGDLPCPNTRPECAAAADRETRPLDLIHPRGEVKADDLVIAI